MSHTDALNLARRPFVNARPVQRVAILLWALAALLLAANVALFWGYFAGSGEQRARLGRVEAEIKRNRDRIGTLQSNVAGLDLGHQNERVLFLNERIAERTFSWSMLFDRMAEVLPRDVRLERLTPATAAEQGKAGVQRRSWRPSEGSDEVVLTISGEAKSDEVLLELQDNLFSHPAFDEPNLTHETKSEETGLISFDLRVGYRPHAAGAAGAGPAAPGAVTVEEEPLPGQPGQSGQPGQPPAATEAAPPTGGGR